MQSYTDALKAHGFSDAHDNRCTYSNGSPNACAVYVVTIEYLMLKGPKFSRDLKELVISSFNFRNRNPRVESYFEFPEGGEILSGLFRDLYSECFSKEAPRHGRSTVLYLPEHKSERLKKFLVETAKKPRIQNAISGQPISKHEFPSAVTRVRKPEFGEGDLSIFWSASKPL